MSEVLSIEYSDAVFRDSDSETSKPFELFPRPRINPTAMLISEVNKHPCLWNSSKPEYMNKIQRDEAWDQISSKLNLGYDDLTREEKSRVCDENKKKWNNIRDSYRKYLNRQKISSKCKPFAYEPFIYFVKPYFTKKYSDVVDGSFKQQSEPESQDENEDSETAEFVQSASEDNIEQDEEEHSNRKTLRQDEPPRKRKKKHKNQVKMNNMQFVNIEEDMAQADFDYLDEDSQFLLSFRNDLKKMSRSEKIKFKLAMTKLVLTISESKSSFFNGDINYQDEDSQFLLSFRNDLLRMSVSEKLRFKLGMTQIVQQITESRSNNFNSKYNDEDSQYLLSLRNDLKTMSKSEKLKFKKGMIELIQSIAEGSTPKIYAESVDDISFTFET